MQCRLKTAFPWFTLQKSHLFLTLPLLMEKRNNTLSFQQLGSSFLLPDSLQYFPLNCIKGLQEVCFLNYRSMHVHFFSKMERGNCARTHLSPNCPHRWQITDPHFTSIANLTQRFCICNNSNLAFQDANPKVEQLVTAGWTKCSSPQWINRNEQVFC